VGKESLVGSCLEGFRVIGRYPAALAFWALFYVVLFVVAFGALALTVGPAFMSAAQHQIGAPAFAAMFQRIGVGFLIVGPIVLLGSVTLNAAVYRAVLRPQDKAFGFLRIGGDELRMFVVALALFVVFLLLYFSSVFVGLALLSGGSRNPVAAWIYGLIVFGIFVFLAVKFSLALVITFAEKKIRIVDSWAVTDRHFWPLLAMYALVVIFLIVLAVVFAFAQSFIGQLVGIPAAFPWGRVTAAASSPRAALVGGGLALVFGLTQAVLQLALINAPQAAAYRILTGAGKTDPAKVF
jgi:hypothetical protein